MRNTAQPTSQDSSNLKRYIGREYEKVNCWQLAREFYLHEFRVELKHYYEGNTPARDETKNLIFSNIGDFEKVEGAPEYGDLILIRLHGIESHIGIFIKGDRFLHSARTVGSVLDDLKKYAPNVVAYYRLKGLKRDKV